MYNKLRQTGFKRVVTVALLLAAGLAAAQSGTPIFGGRSESEMLVLQQKVESLYEQGEYERAFFIYQQELAPLADKYAQYMIGFMYLTGTGVEQDRVLASAWYRLAAERSYPEFATIRDQLLSSFDAATLAQSDEQYRRLRKEYSDIAILMQLVRRDSAAWDEQTASRPQTGSRLSGTTGPVVIVDPSSGHLISGPALEQRYRQRSKMHLERLQQLLPDATIDTDIRKVDLDQLQALVNQQLDVIDDRSQQREFATER